MEGDMIEVKVTPIKIFHPKNTDIIINCWGSTLCSILEVTKGQEVLRDNRTLKLAGIFSTFRLQKEYNVVAVEQKPSKYGVQYEVLNCMEAVDLSDEQSARLFLRTIFTERQVKNLYDTLGNPIPALEGGNIEELTKVPEVGAKVASDMVKKFNENKDLSRYYAEMSKYDLTPNMQKKLLEHYNKDVDKIIQIMIDNPYLITEVEGIGFKKADEIALKAGMAEQSPLRINAFIQYLLSTKAEQGDSYCYIDDILDEIDFTLGEVENETLLQVLRELEDKKTIWVSKDRSAIALYKYYNLEKKIAYELMRILKAENTFNFEGWEDKIKDKEQEQGWEFTEEQKLGIKTILENQITIIVGGAGCGKTSSVAGMLSVFGDKYTFSQTALSGRASCNMSDVTGVEGYTIHRLLAYNPIEGFEHKKDNPLEDDIIILDEGSMVGLDIFYKLVQAIKTGAKLIILGDEGQLEAIGAGNLLYDMIDSGIIPMVRLTKVHRQAEKSAIITEANKIRQGEQITEKGFMGAEIRGELKDLEIDVYKDKEDTQKNIIKHYKELLDKGINYRDIQVILPVKDRGEACTSKLNNIIQKIVIDTNHEEGLTINPNANNPITLYVGDKVMQTKNNYQSTDECGREVPIYNGDMGTVVDVDRFTRTVIVNFFTKGRIIIKEEDLFAIDLAYACTTHKLQGSSSPYVICGIDYSHYMLLCRQMLYTMLTRAKKYCVLCAESKALRHAIRTDNVVSKQTFLTGFLKGQLPLPEISEKDRQIKEVGAKTSKKMNFGDEMNEDLEVGQEMSHIDIDEETSVDNDDLLF